MSAKLRSKWRRYKMGRKFRHMAELHPDFFLDLQNSTQSIIWKKHKVAEITPLASIPGNKNDLAFIVGSGPSLKHTDISPISNQISIGVNGSIMKFIEHQIKPNYYVISDADFVKERWHLVQKMISLKPHCIFTPSVVNEICLHEAQQLCGLKVSVFDNHFKIYNKQVMEYQDIIQLAAKDEEIITHDGKVGFSLNPTKGVFTAHTVVFHALQIAYGLGYRNIGILGMDLNYEQGQTRFYETGKNATDSHLLRDYYSRILPSFMVVKYLCEQNKLSVYNLSQNSRLPEDVIPKIDLTTLLTQ